MGCHWGGFTQRKALDHEIDEKIWKWMRALWHSMAIPADKLPVFRLLCSFRGFQVHIFITCFYFGPFESHPVGLLKASLSNLLWSFFRHLQEFRKKWKQHELLLRRADPEPLGLSWYPSPRPFWRGKMMINPMDRWTIKFQFSAQS